MQSRAERTAALLRWEIAETISQAQLAVTTINRQLQEYKWTPENIAELEWEREQYQRSITYYSKQLNDMGGIVPEVTDIAITDSEVKQILTPLLNFDSCVSGA